MISAKPRVFALFVFIICAAAFFVACAPIDRIAEFFADDGTGRIFKISISSDPQNLDPQLANDESSVMIAKNLYIGLTDYDPDGNIVCRLAESYTVSEDGLVYTFKLKEGYNWYAVGEFTAPVTADDFVFAFRRLFNPKTESPHAEEYFCISGARAARSGEFSPEEIGVRAIDAYTLEFTLEYPNAEFIYLLAELPAMPCCEEYFNNNSDGKYGLEAEYTCCNGPFYIRYWLHDRYGSDNYVRLRRNPAYNEISAVSPAGVNYLINRSFDSQKNDFADGVTDLMLFKAEQSLEQAFPSREYKAEGGYTAVAGLVFNEKIEAFSQKEIRQVFSWGIDREALKGSAPGLSKLAGGLIPYSPKISARGYYSEIPSGTAGSDLAAAEYKWSFLLTDRQKSELLGMTVMVPSDFEYSGCLSGLTESWYSVFGIHFGIEIVSPSDYSARISKGDYDIALATISSKTGSPADYIHPFAKEGRFGFKVKLAEEAESRVGRYSTLSEMNRACAEAENSIISDYRFIPLFQLQTVCGYDGDIEDLGFDPFSSTVYFESAKMF